MDSITQMALGAAVTGAVMGRRLGGRAFVWGAAIGTLPDLDSFIPMGGPVADFTYHRGYTHSLLVQTAVSPFLAWGINRWYGGDRENGRTWLLAVWLTLITHALLDCFTIYGTQLWLPFTDYPVGLGSIFIIDPLYTLPLLVGIAMALRRRGDWRRARRRNYAGLALSCTYLGWTVVAQQAVEVRGRAALAEQGLSYEHMLATPTPLNTALWRVLAVGEQRYFEGFYTIASGAPIDFQPHDTQPELLTGIERRWAVARLEYFTKGFYSVTRDGKSVIMTDLRMGQAPSYAFAFQVGRLGEGGVEAVADQRQPTSRPPAMTLISDLFACATGEPTQVIVC